MSRIKGWYMSLEERRIRYLNMPEGTELGEGWYKVAMPLFIYVDGKLCTVDGETYKAPVR